MDTAEHQTTVVVSSASLLTLSNGSPTVVCGCRTEVPHPTDFNFDVLMLDSSGSFLVDKLITSMMISH